MVCVSPVTPKRKEEFLNGHVGKRKDQKWVRDFPSEAEIDQLNEADRDALQDRELDRRENGCWFLNDGEPVYLTGDNYFYLTHFKLPAGYYPEFRMADVMFYWWWKAIEDDPNCIGGIFLGARQRGKTARAAALLLNYASFYPNVWCGITSKKKEDAKDVFQSFIVTGWQNMSALIRPKAPAGDSPKSELLFAAEARKGRASLGQRQWALNSKIDYRDSKENAYDSKTLNRKFSDEPFKEQLYNSEERRKIESRMMWRAGIAIGKMLLASTIDEQEAFDPVIAETMWGEANPAELSTTGRTKNGLKRLMMPVTEAHKMDEYGRSNLVTSLADIEANAPTDPIQRRSYYRANPRHEADAFSSGGKDSIFNLENLDAAKLRVANLPTPEWTRVDLVWDDMERTKVKTVLNRENGRFLVIMRALPDIQGRPLNNVTTHGTHTGLLGEMTRYKPTHDAVFAIGVDPYDARQVRELGQASKGAAYLFWKPDVLNEADRYDTHGDERANYWPSDGFLVEYVNRPPRPSDFYEDLIKLCHLFSCSILPENNKPGVIAYFEDRGYGDFIHGKISIIGSKDKSIGKKTKNDTPGMAASVDATGQWAERISEFTHGPLGDDLRRMPFAHQIKDVSTLDILNTKKYDSAVATGWTLLLARKAARPKAKPVDMGQFSARNFFNIA